MNRLLDIQERIRTTTAALGQLESELAKKRDSPSLNANIRSLRKLYGNLTSDFDDAASKFGLDVCRYRLLEERPTVRTLSKSLGSFQDALATMFESLAKGPKKKRILSAETVSQTELSVAYTFPGSFGVVLTVPNQPLLTPEFFSDLDKAMDMVFSVARARTSDEVLTLSKRVGKAPVVAVYEWASSNAKNAVGTDIEWKRGGNIRNHLLMQYPEFNALSGNIARTAEKQTAETSARGVLVGADTLTKRFHFVTDGTDEDIRGRFDDAISESQTAELPATYTAHFRKTTTLSLATDEEHVEYFLLRLESSKDGRSKG